MKCPRTAFPDPGAFLGQRGFTLLEAMIVVVIMGVLGAIAFPSMQQMIEAERVRSATSALYDSLIIARSEAVKRNTGVRFSYVGASLADGWSVVTNDDDEITVHAQQSLPNVVFDPQSPAFVFNRTGRLTGGDAVPINVTADDSSVARCLRVINGRPSVEPRACRNEE